MPPVGARVMDLQHPERKMSKSEDSPLGTIDLLDEPAEIERKVRRAVTDTGTDVRYDPETRPGLANLLEIFGAVTDREPAEVAARYDRYGPLKADLAEALIEALRPVQERYAELLADQGAVSETLAKGAAKAAALAAPDARARPRRRRPPAARVVTASRRRGGSRPGRRSPTEQREHVHIFGREATACSYALSPRASKMRIQRYPRTRPPPRASGSDGEHGWRRRLQAGRSFRSRCD